MNNSDLAIIADFLFDGRHTEPLERPLITIAAGRITSGEDRLRDWSRPSDLQVTHLEGCTVLPGLVDAHVHLALTGETSAEAIAFAESASENESIDVMREHAEES